MKRKVCLMATALVVISSLTGCGGVTKEELQAQNNMLISDLSEAEEEIEKLETTIKTLVGDNSLVGITKVADGSKETFNSVDGNILFPAELSYTGSYQAPNTASLNLASRISIKPSDNWKIQINGTTTKYSHPDGVYGTIKIVGIEEPIKGEFIEEQMIDPFTSAIPYTSKSNAKIYLDDIWRGMNTEMTVLNNEKPAVIKAGLVGQGDTAIIYSFYYNGDKNATKNELITTLLQTIKFGGLEMRIE